LQKGEYRAKSSHFFRNIVKNIEYLAWSDPLLHITKVLTVRLNAISGKHRIVESHDPATQTIKYLLTNRLAWEATKIISVYSHRWVIEEFFKNAKQFGVGPSYVSNILG
jgi:IS4 transposase